MKGSRKVVSLLLHVCTKILGTYWPVYEDACADNCRYNFPDTPMSAYIANPSKGWSVLL